MRGVGRATSAITIVNALSTGVGAALGISLGAEASVTLRAGNSGAAASLGHVSEPRTKLVETSALLALDRYFPASGVVGDVRVRSEVPPARGLKSSSAVASAIVQAVARAADARPSAEEIARLAAQAGRAAGVSATGAFDDALAGLRPGFVLTDNRLGTLLRSDPADPGWEVAILLPPGTHRPSPEWSRAFAFEESRGRAAVEAARAGRWWEALTRNTEIVERVMGYSNEALRSRLLGAGALAAGVSGLGPALAAVAPSARIEAVLAVLGTEEGERLRLRPSTGRRPARRSGR